MSIAEKLTVTAKNEQKIKIKVNLLESEIENVNNMFNERSIYVNNKDYDTALNEAQNIDFKEFVASRGMVYLYAFYIGEYIPNRFLPLNNDNQNSCEGMYYNCVNLKEAPEIDMSNSLYFHNMFLGCESLITAPVMDTGKGSRFAAMFGQCTALKTIPQLNISSCTLRANLNNIFSGCTALENIIFIGTINVTISFQDCPLLTVDSLNSIVTALKDLKGQTTQTITLHTTSKAKLTTEQISIIKNKNWTLA
ncbi:MAG: hypothetical protein IKT38_08010 [Clostridia bacterium]|nr:hypothetical protein [Clostridia bacterium]